MSFHGGSVIKNPPASAGVKGSIPGSGRLPGEGNGYPLQYPCLENPMDRGAWWFSLFQFRSVAQSCLTLCDPMNRSTPGLPVHHQLPEFSQTHIHQVSDATSSSVVPFFSRLQSFPASVFSPMSQFLTLGGRSIRVSASASVLPMNIQD